MQLLYRINRAGTTVVVATHDAQMVDRMRRRVIELQGGRDRPRRGRRPVRAARSRRPRSSALLRRRHTSARDPAPATTPATDALGFFLREALRSLRRNAVPRFAAMASVLVTDARPRRLHPGRAGHDGRGQRGARQGARRRLPARPTPAEADVERVRRVLDEQDPVRRQGRVRLQGAGLHAGEASATRRPTSCWAPTRCPTPSASRPTARTTSMSCATRWRPAPSGRAHASRPGDRRGQEPARRHDEDPHGHARGEAQHGGAGRAARRRPRSC